MTKIKKSVINYNRRLNEGFTRRVSGRSRRLSSFHVKPRVVMHTGHSFVYKLWIFCALTGVCNRGKINSALGVGDCPPPRQSGKDMVDRGASQNDVNSRSIFLRGHVPESAVEMSAKAARASSESADANSGALRKRIE